MKLHVLNVNELTILPNRQRREFPPEKIQELASSLSQNGLIHPLVVRREGEKVILVAGERRLKAILYLWQFGEKLRCGEHTFEEGDVPCLYQGELDPIAAFEMELEENIQRDDLTWKEKAAATAQLMALRQMQAERDGKPNPTTADIAEEVRGQRDGWHIAETKKELIVARHLDDPDIADAKSTEDAFKILVRKEQQKKNADLAVQVGKTFSAADHRLMNLDSLIWLRDECPPESFDVILTDPPYGMGADEFGDSDGRAAGAHRYKDDYDTWTQIMDSFSRSSFIAAKPQAHLYMFCDIDLFLEAKDYMQTAGWTVFRTPLIWHKPGGMRAPWPQMGPQRKYEIILYAVKGKRPVNKLAPDVITCNPDDNLGHQAQKPVALFSDLLKRSVRAGDTVLDPFCGSGTIFPACHELKCRATGIEIDPASYGLAMKRLGELK